MPLRFLTAPAACERYIGAVPSPASSRPDVARRNCPIPPPQSLSMMYEPDLPCLSPKGLPPVRDSIRSDTLEDLCLMAPEARSKAEAAAAPCALPQKESSGRVSSSSATTPC